MTLQTYLQKIDDAVARAADKESVLLALLAYWTRQLNNSRRGKPILPGFTPSDITNCITEIELKIQESRNAKK